MSHLGQNFKAIFSYFFHLRFYVQKCLNLEHFNVLELKLHPFCEINGADYCPKGKFQQEELVYKVGKN